MTKQERKLYKKLRDFDDNFDGIELLLVNFILDRNKGIIEFKKDVILLKAYKSMFLK